MKTKIMRVSEELSNEMINMAKKNDMKTVDVSKEVAKMLREQRTRKNKIMKEIKF